MYTHDIDSDDIVTGYAVSEKWTNIYWSFNLKAKLVTNIYLHST